MRRPTALPVILPATLAILIMSLRFIMREQAPRMTTNWPVENPSILPSPRITGRRRQEGEEDDLATS
jgi:hypothetical protein